jgi:hypothetical protein
LWIPYGDNVSVVRVVERSEYRDITFDEGSWWFTYVRGRGRCCYIGERIQYRELHGEGMVERMLIK